MAAARVDDDERALYGREYWFAHQERDLGCPNILVRARADLPERCLYWLRAVLKYKVPPARVLELGSGPGGFVAMLRWAGFDVTGLELSPWVVQFIRETFQVPVLLGPVEDQEIEPGSLDVIALMDVLEHLHDPVGTMRHCLGLLRADGILLIQTPCYPDERTYEEMLAGHDRFLEMSRPTDHLHLFSRHAISDLLRSLGADHVVFEPALFAEYDMFVVASRVPLVTCGPAEIDAALSARPAGRMIQALLDLDVARSDLGRRYAAAEFDRTARLEALKKQGRQLGEAEGERNALRAEVDALRRELEVAEADRAARLEVIEAQARWLGEVEADRAARLEVIETQGRRLEEIEAERNNLRAQVETQGRRLGEIEAERNNLRAQVETQGRRLGEMEAERNNLRAQVEAQQRQMELLMAQVRNLRELITKIQSTRRYKLLRRLGRWKWAEEAIAPGPAGSSNPPTVAPTPEGIKFDASYANIREPKKQEWILYPPGAEDRIAERLRALGFDVRRYEVDVADYRRYFVAAHYLEKFPDYYPSYRAEKSLEHYLAAKLLQFGEQDVYIDIASEHSPAPDIYRSLFGVTAYRQDLAYPAGLDGDRMGGDAARLPVPDKFATKMALHCSFEHFEGKSDIRFLREARRVLRPGGAVCVVPLYLFEEYAIQTDPEVAVRSEVVFEKDATVYCARGWGNRHGRFYDPEHLATRILANAESLTVEIYRIANATDVDPSCYVRFAMVIRKPATDAA